MFFIMFLMLSKKMVTIMEFKRGLLSDGNDFMKWKWATMKIMSLVLITRMLNEWGLMKMVLVDRMSQNGWIYSRCFNKKLFL